MCTSSLMDVRATVSARTHFAIRIYIYISIPLNYKRNCFTVPGLQAAFVCCPSLSPHRSPQRIVCDCITYLRVREFPAGWQPNWHNSTGARERICQINYPELPSRRRHRVELSMIVGNGNMTIVAEVNRFGGRVSTAFVCEYICLVRIV